MRRLQRRLRTKHSYFIFYSTLLLPSLFPYAMLFFKNKTKQETFKTWHASKRAADKKVIMYATIYKGYCRARGRSRLGDRTCGKAIACFQLLKMGEHTYNPCNVLSVLSFLPISPLGVCACICMFTLRVQRCMNECTYVCMCACMHIGVRVSPNRLGR